MSKGEILQAIPMTMTAILQVVSIFFCPVQEYPNFY